MWLRRHVLRDVDDDEEGVGPDAIRSRSDRLNSAQRLGEVGGWCLACHILHQVLQITCYNYT